MLPSYCALNAIVLPSGENAGFDSTPSSVVSRRTLLTPVEVGDAEVAGVDEGEMGGADGGLRQHLRVGRIDASVEP